MKDAKMKALREQAVKKLSKMDGDKIAGLELVIHAYPRDAKPKKVVEVEEEDDYEDDDEMDEDCD